MEPAKLLHLASMIDRLDYYQILGVPPQSSQAEIRTAYHRRARSIHPDLFHEDPDPKLREAVDIIFKRVAEAYLILREEQKRTLYNQGLTAPQKKLRYTEQDEQARKDEKKAAFGTTMQGKKYFQEAERLHKSGEIKKACQSLRFALTFEPDNAHFKQLLQQWEGDAPR